MDENLAMKWVAELRSGKHRQTRGVLLDESGCKCATGVLAVDVMKVDEKFVLGQAAVGTALYLAGVSCPLRDNLGEMSNSPGVATSVVGMNDTGWSFEQIADVIEANYEYL